jgi:hypothetical protein
MDELVRLDVTPVWGDRVVARDERRIVARLVRHRDEPVGVRRESAARTSSADAAEAQAWSDGYDGCPVRKAIRPTRMRPPVDA